MGVARAQQDDLSPPDMLLGSGAIPREHIQTAAISGLEGDGNSGSHAPGPHASRPLGIPPGIQMSDAIHEFLHRRSWKVGQYRARAAGAAGLARVSHCPATFLSRARWDLAALMFDDFKEPPRALIA